MPSKLDCKGFVLTGLIVWIGRDHELYLVPNMEFHMFVRNLKSASQNQPVALVLPLNER